MRRYAKALVMVVLSVAMAFSTAPARAARGHAHASTEAARPCYWIFVAREGKPQEGGTARVCEGHIGTILEWMRVVPGVPVSHLEPQGPLNDCFTVMIAVAKAHQEMPPGPGLEWGSFVLTVRVYPVSASGPVAFVPSRTVFHGSGPYPRFVVPMGWRSLAASEQVPTALRQLGMLQPTATPTTPTLAPTAAAPTTTPNHPGPDLVTFLFIAAILVAAGAVVRRNVGRTQSSGHSEVPHHG